MLTRSLLQAIGLAAALGPVAAADELVVAGFLDAHVRRHDGAGGAFLATMGDVYAPTGMTRGPDGHLYVTSGFNEVYRFDGATGAPLGLFATETTGLLDHATGVAFAPDGRLCVASYVGDRVLRFDGATGAFVDVFVPDGSGGLSSPEAGMAFGPDGNLYVPSSGTDSILRYDGSTGAFLDAWAPPRTGGLSGPRAIVFDAPNDRAYVVSGRNDIVLRFEASTGRLLGSVIAADRPRSPTGLAITPDGASFVVTSPLEDAVRRYDLATGAYRGFFVTPGAGGLDYPLSILFVPEPRLPLEVAEPAVAGATSVVRARGAGAGERVAFAFSGAPGATPARGCAPLALDLASPRLAGVARADASGVAEIARLVPARFAGRTLFLQALAPDSCRKSAALATEIR